MKTLAAVLLAILLPLTAQAAAATYEATRNGVKGVCASGTCDAPVEAAGLTDGLPLVSSFFTTVNGLAVTVCADDTRTLSGAGTLTAYVWEPSTGLWAAVPDLNLTVSSSARRCQSFTGFLVTLAVGRITWVATGVTVSAGGTTVYVSGW